MESEEKEEETDLGTIKYLQQEVDRERKKAEDGVVQIRKLSKELAKVKSSSSAGANFVDEDLVEQMAKEKAEKIADEKYSTLQERQKYLIDKVEQLTKKISEYEAICEHLLRQLSEAGKETSLDKIKEALGLKHMAKADSETGSTKVGNYVENDEAHQSVPLDGDCLYESVRRGMCAIRANFSQTAPELRQTAASQLRDKGELYWQSLQHISHSLPEDGFPKVLSIEAAISRIEKPGSFGGNMEVKLLTDALNVNIRVIMQNKGKDTSFTLSPGWTGDELSLTGDAKRAAKDTIAIRYFANNKHYEAVA